MKIKFNITIKRRMLINSFMFIVLPLLIFAILNHLIVDAGLKKQIADRLKGQALQTRILIQNAHSEILDIKKEINTQAKNIVKSQAMAISKIVEQFQGTDEQLKSLLSSIKVGHTGYIWILDYEGNYIVSLGRKRDGENVIKAKDSNGVLFIEEAINKAQKIKGNGIDYQIYPWINKDEKKARNKIAALVNDRKRKWVLGISVYFDELVDENKINKKLEILKDEISKFVIGKTGYVFILDSKGNYIVSKDRKRDGENVYNAKDADGNLFIQEMCSNGKKLKSTEANVIYYTWLEKGATTPKLKIASYSYFPELDWIIGPSAYQEDFLDILDDIKITSIIVILISLALGLLISILFTNSIIRPILMIKEKLSLLADGELIHQIEHIDNNEIGEISESYNLALNQLTRSLSDVKDTVKIIQTSVSNISSGNNDLHTRTNEQAASITETSTTMEEFSTILKVTKDSTEEVNSKLSNLNADLQLKQNLIDNVTTTMSEINESSKKIDNFVNVINDISFQTNLLALNAAVEAARAGEAGRGFAVVASEVRTLAQKTAESSKSIQDIVTNNLQSTQKGTELVKNTSVFFTSVKTVIDEILKAITQVTEGTKEQHIGIEQINIAINQLEDVLNKNVALSKNLTDNGNDMLEQSNKLMKNVSKFIIS